MTHFLTACLSIKRDDWGEKGEGREGKVKCVKCEMNPRELGLMFPCMYRLYTLMLKPEEHRCTTNTCNVLKISHI